jgi:hypothetical protein
MLRLVRTAIAGFFLLATAASVLAATPSPDVAIVKAEFGIFQDDGSDQLGFGATDEIPATAGQAYGWLIEVKTASKSLAVREEMRHLLEPPATSGDKSDDPNAYPAKTSFADFRERQVSVANGVIFGEHKIATNDKPGWYRLRVYVERTPVATFDYQLVSP